MKKERTTRPILDPTKAAFTSTLSAPPSASDWANSIVGRTVGDFLIGERFQQGGYGLIFHAKQLALMRDVVIKVMRKGGSRDIAITQRFLREAKLASQLDHPYAAHIYAFGAEQDGMLWIAMELVRGTSLEQVLANQGSLSLARFVPLLEKLCEVVYTAHEQGIIHRDIKPSNVMVLSRAGRLLPKLLDLGIARLVDDEAEVKPPPRENPIQRGDSEITHRGASLGSPAYMPPEQWVASDQCDARSDQYSLAVLAYESITGQRPFDAADASGMSKAHLEQQMPPLSEDFPSGLSGVIERGLSKQSADRYADVLEFAREFRAAAGLDDDLEPLPRLDVLLRETLLSRAPQPLADSVASLEASRDPIRALEAAFVVTRVAMRLSGILAVAALTRLGLKDSLDAVQAREALRRLRRKTLTTGDWFGITQALVKPFEQTPDAHPIPELVLLFTLPGDHAENAHEEDVSGKLDLRPQVFNDLWILDSFTQSNDPRTALSKMLPTLGHLLESLSFLCEYRLVVHRNGRNEAWMGARRSVRAEVTLSRQELDLQHGDVVVVGSDGELLLSLNPLCQLSSPAPGAPEELFLFDGKGRFGARLLAFPIGFEWHDSAFYNWYHEHLVELDQTVRDPESEVADSARPPYKGLSAFSPADSDNYFGREREVGSCFNRLRIEPLLVVVGPSGAGKSSFVQAGIIPVLPENWRAITVRPGPKPLSRLASVLRREGIIDMTGAKSSISSHQRLVNDSDTLGELLRERGRQTGETLVLVVDQFEELLTLGSSPDEQRLYSQALINAARISDDPVRVIITLRDDFLLRAQQLPALRERLGQSLQLLATPPADELQRILVEPARRAGYEFESEQLLKDMVNAIADEPSALALLSFTASKLWEMRDRHFHKLRRASYEKLGGVGGALAQHAEETLGDMTDAQKKVVREICRQLVTADGTRAVLTRRELAQMLGAQSESDAVLESLIHARLLVASEGEDGDDRVEVVHEALLSSWPRLVTWQREDAETVRLRDQLRSAARQWTARDRSRGMLWRGDALLEYRVWRSRYAGSLTDDEEAFARYSLAEEARGQRRKRILLVSAFTILAIGLVLMLQLERRASKARDQANNERMRAEAMGTRAEQRLLDMYQEQGRLASLSGEYTKALAYLNEARRGGHDSAALRFLLGRATDATQDQLHVLPAEDGMAWSVAFSPDGTHIASGGERGTVRLWNATTGERRYDLEGHTKAIWMLAFSPDGTRLLSTSWDGSARVWNVKTGELAWTATHDRTVSWGAYNATGTLVGTGSSDKAIKLWNAQSGQLMRTIEHDAPISSAAFSPDGTFLVSGDAFGGVRRWEIATGALLGSYEVHKSFLKHLTVSPDSTWIATAGSDNLASLIPVDNDDGASKPIVLRKHDDLVNRVVFSPDSARLVTVSEDQTATLWDARTGELVRELDGHTGAVADAVFTPDGIRLATLSRDNTAMLWDVGTGRRIWTFIGHTENLWRAAFDHEGKRLATAAFDGTVRVWRATYSIDAYTTPAHDGVVVDASPSPDGSLIATAQRAVDNGGGVVQIWSQQNERVATMTGVFPIIDSTTLHVAWHPTGDRVLLSGGPRAIAWQTSTGTELGRFGEHGKLTHYAMYTADGERVLTTGTDGTAKIWDSDTGALRLTLDGHDGAVVFAALSPNGQFVATASADRTAMVWNLASRQRIATMSSSPPQKFNAVAFSPDSKFVATSGDDTTAIIWTVDGHQSVTLEGHASSIPSIVFSPDGRLIATGSEDGTASVWDVNSGVRLWSSDRQVDRVWSVAFAPDTRQLMVARGRFAFSAYVTYDDRSVNAVEEFVACRSGYSLSQARLVRADINVKGRCRR